MLPLTQEEKHVAQICENNFPNDVFEGTVEFFKSTLNTCANIVDDIENTVNIHT